MLPPALNHVVADLQAVPAFPAETKFLSALTSENKLVPSIIKPPELELKKLPEHIKWVYLGELDTGGEERNLKLFDANLASNHIAI